MSLIKLDSKIYNVGEVRLQRTAEIIYDPLTQGVMIDFSEMDDAVATKYVYNLTVERRVDSANGIDEYDAFYYDITTPKSVRLIELPFANGRTAFKAKIKVANDNLYKSYGGTNKWGGLTVTIEPVAPQRYADETARFMYVQTTDDEKSQTLYIKQDEGVFLFSIDGANWIQGKMGEKGEIGETGYNGWTAVTSVVADGERRVLKVADWTGGTGSKPTAGVYVGSSGFVSNIAQAADIRGATGLPGATGPQGVQGPQGVKGEKGDTGPQGAAGTSVNVANNLTTTEPGYVLDARQGKALSEAIPNAVKTHNDSPTSHRAMLATPTEFAQGSPEKVPTAEQVQGGLGGRVPRIPAEANTLDIGSVEKSFRQVYTNRISMGTRFEQFVGFKQSVAGAQANRKFDILFPKDGHIYGWIEVEIVSGQFYSNPTGSLKKRIDISWESNTTAAATQNSHYTEVSALTAASFAISDMKYTAEKGRHITIANRKTDTGFSAVGVYVRGFLAHSPLQINPADITLSDIYTTDTTVYPEPVSWVVTDDGVWYDMVLQNGATAGGEKLRCRKVGNIAFVEGTIKLPANPATNIPYAAFPEGYNPANKSHRVFCVSEGLGGVGITFWLHSNGGIYVSSPLSGSSLPTTSTSYHINHSFIIG